MKTMTRNGESSALSESLLVAFELGERTWKVGCTVGVGQRPRTRDVPAGALVEVMEAIARAKRTLGLAADAPVVSCYEAGRVGFWLHRYLVAQGITNHVVDSSSIEVNRRARRMKTDRLDLIGLLRLLARYVWGEAGVWRLVRVPTLEDEDGRHWHRLRETVQQDRTRVINRIKGVLATLGIRVAVTRGFPRALAQTRLWTGASVPAGAAARLLREWGLLQDLDRHLAEIDEACDAVPLNTVTRKAVTTLETVRGIGRVSAQVLATEIFGWRQIRNGRELGALVGLVPGRYQSGESDCELGITRAGNAHVRRISVQLAWSWLRNQRDSALAQWYQRRFGGGSKRLRRSGVVALARKLLIALWRYVDHGQALNGAVLKPVVHH